MTSHQALHDVWDFTIRDQTLRYWRLGVLLSTFSENTNATKGGFYNNIVVQVDKYISLFGLL